MTIDTKPLRELAAKATPGPWKWDARRNYCDEHDSFLMPMNVFIPDELPDEDAAYIVAINPEVLTELLDEIDRLREQVERLSAGYADAIEDIEGWGVYASPYFQEKHDLQGDIAAHSETLHTFGTGKRVPELKDEK